MQHPLAAFVPYAVISVLPLVFILTGNQTLTDIAATARMPLLALAVVIVLKGASRSLAGILLLIAILVVLWPDLGRLAIAVAIYGAVLAMRARR